MIWQAIVSQFMFIEDVDRFDELLTLLIPFVEDSSKKKIQLTTDEASFIFKSDYFNKLDRNIIIMSENYEILESLIFCPTLNLTFILEYKISDNWIVEVVNLYKAKLVLTWIRDE